LPFHLFARPLQSWCRMKETDCCVLVGILLDNAREAAIKAAAPFVSVEVRNAEDMLEFVIRNTYASPPRVADLRRDGYTTKEGTGGVGLASARRILSRHSKAQLNTSVQGQYVVQQLLLP
jgi:two-component system sensor histidine kinase AgrC